jgi:predicted kinase
VLIVLSGLPGVGKTAIATHLAGMTGGVHIRIDSIEQALRDAGVHVEGHGYEVAYAVALDNLRQGRIVIADCVNPLPLTRHAWRATALAAAVPQIDVEVICSDAAEHRRRVETRVADIPGHVVPTWAEVVGRDYRAWEAERIVVDTALLDPSAAAGAVLRAIQLNQRAAHDPRAGD